MVLVAKMVAKAALMREESRGAHYRTDFPEMDDANWLVNLKIKQEQGNMYFTKIPVILTRIEPEA